MRKLFLVNLLENYLINKHNSYGVTFIFLIYKYLKDFKEITYFKISIFYFFKISGDRVTQDTNTDLLL